mmetsp:Transcript_26546/g.62312  ORF Transcript_26546/g.62312 Transcript_26546/m.62312 type:complete len:116 (-) Transcript_26546:36-383(-)
MASESKDEGAAGGAGGEDNAPEATLKIDEWRLVAMWSWDVVNETCAVCRFPITDLCIECNAGSHGANPECAIAWGGCSHQFHSHCIQNWLEKRNTCPVDNNPWEWAQIEDQGGSK